MQQSGRVLLKKIKVRTKCDTHCFAKVRKCDTSVSPSMKIWNNMTFQKKPRNSHNYCTWSYCILWKYPLILILSNIAPSNWQDNPMPRTNCSVKCFHTPTFLCNPRLALRMALSKGKGKGKQGQGQEPEQEFHGRAIFHYETNCFSQKLHFVTLPGVLKVGVTIYRFLQ